jgi:septal ring factor EnvC (AmiA/AmiB activator)
LLLVVAPAVAQENTRKELRDSQLRLEQIRQERSKLEEEMGQLKSRVRDSSRELANIEKQRIASINALREVEFQSDVLSKTVDETSSQRGQTEAKLVERQASLADRLRSMYKRGDMHATRVLLTAESFGDLLQRYKYLRMIALYERAVIDDVSRLETQLKQQEEDLRNDLTRLDNLRDEREREVQRLRNTEAQASRTLKDYQGRQVATQGRLDQLIKDEASVNSAVAALERKRREEEGSAAKKETTLTTRDLGALNWPVEGQLVFRFGPERKPNGVVLRYNGIGIAAPAGTAVKAVEAGTIERAGQLEGYGLAVIIGHGGGSYTLYLRLQQVSVREGQRVTAGTVIGTVGGEGSEFGPHLEFQVRLPTNGSPTAVDPLDWLRSRQ